LFGECFSNIFVLFHRMIYLSRNNYLPRFRDQRAGVARQWDPDHFEKYNKRFKGRTLDGEISEWWCIGRR
jgi:hypothetical protein